MHAQSAGVAEDFEIIDLRAICQENVGRFNSLFAAFKRLYVSSFPDPREREDADDWLLRLSGHQASPQPYMHLQLAVNRSDQILGGICFEHYRSSRCGLLTYIVVDKRARRRGISRKLTVAAIERLNEAGRRSDQPLRAIFAEAEVPSELAPRLRPGAYERLAILGRLGARYVDMPYVQPALSGGAGRARHLMLLLFGGSESQLDNAVVHDFMHEFYRALGVAVPERDVDFQAMFARSPARIPTALLEAPALRAANVAYCLHYVEANVDTSTPFDQLGDCTVFNSMELDLLSHSFQSRVPFKTRRIALHGGGEVDRNTDYGASLTIEYPLITTYFSEGRRELLYCTDRQRKVKAYVACTRFRGSRIAVWHVVLRPVDGGAFSEFDLIKLAHLHGGRTEGTGLLQQVQFRPDGRTSVGAERLLAALLDRQISDRGIAPAGGTIQWNVGDASGEVTAASALTDEELATVLVRQPNADAVSTLVNSIDLPTSQGRQLKALCGVITGIFDFGEIGRAEAIDTVAATWVQPGVYIRVHRGTLLQICAGDRPMAATRWTIGISPYLLVPHAAILFNEHLLADAAANAAQANLLRSRAGWPDALQGWLDDLTGRSTQQLQRMHAKMDRNLRSAWLQNVFAYETERTIFAQALAGRGATDRHAAVRHAAEEIDSSIKLRWDRRRDKGQMIITSLLAFLSVLQVKDILFDLMDPTKRTPTLWVVCVAGGFAVLIGTVLVHGIRSSRSNRSDD